MTSRTSDSSTFCSSWEPNAERGSGALPVRMPYRPDFASRRMQRCAIMIVDDVAINVKLAEAHLREAGYERLTTETDPTRVLSRLHQELPDLLLLDLMMPHVSGLDLLEAIRSDDRLCGLPVLILTASTDRDQRVRALELGATDFLNKPIDVQDLLPRVRNGLREKLYRDHLEDLVAERTRELMKAQREVVDCLARAGEYRDNDTGRHVMRVGMYVAVIARQLGLDEEMVELLSQASMLHDVGKIGIPDAVMLKPGRLTDEEMQVMRRHCDYGVAICSGFRADAGGGEGSFLASYSSPLLRTAASIVATHHEKWDGSGYPNGLKGAEIPLEGRITAVADVFDALGGRRSYKEPFPLEKCLAIMEEGRGTHFDSRVLDAFLNGLDEILEIREAYADE